MITIRYTLKVVVIFTTILFHCKSECENACSGHGRCTAYDMCICHRNWQSNDCSERICGYALSIVDTPKGDLDSSDSIDGPDDAIIYNSMTYPYGTTEQFPDILNSDLIILNNTAHAYSECSNAGICNRKTGECECYTGFTGSFCQRLLCPGEPECSNNGVCQNLRVTARSENYLSSYKLWDKDITRGCICDKGFYGPDCSMRYCKTGIDPEYLDDVSTINVPAFFLTILTTANNYDINNGFAQPSPGYFRIRVFDQHGQPYLTAPLQARTSCDSIVSALENIPNNVIPIGKTVCYHQRFDDQNGLKNVTIRYESLYKYYFSGIRFYEIGINPTMEEFGYNASYVAPLQSNTLLGGDLYYFQFFGNIGSFQQPEINKYLRDGNRPSLVSQTGTLVAKTWTNGQQGLSIDYFTVHCYGVQIKIISSRGQTFIWGTQFVAEYFHSCLGGADFDSSNDLILSPEIRSTVMNPYKSWDHGSIYNPHLVRLVRQVKDPYDGGFFVVIFFDVSSDFDTLKGDRSSSGGSGAFRILHPFQALDATNKENVIYEAYTTEGVLNAVNTQSESVFSLGSNHIYTLNTNFDLHGLDKGGTVTYDGDISCEYYKIKSGSSSDSKNCLDKNDLFMILDPHTTINNPTYMNLYTAQSIVRFKDQSLESIHDIYKNWKVKIPKKYQNITSRYHKNLIISDYNVNWEQNAIASGQFFIYKFTPNVNTSYTIVSECSNRGLCNTFEGICECFATYTNDDCSIQDSLAV